MSVPIRAGVAQYFGRGDFAWDNSLDVALTILDITSGSPVAVAVVPMVYNAATGTYFAGFTPVAAKSYLIGTAVYTDNTLAVVDTNYAPGSITAYAENAPSGGGSSGGSSQAIVALVNATPTIAAKVSASPTIIATVTSDDTIE